MRPLSLGFSPCPNDTYIFCSLVQQAAAASKPEFSLPCLEDVETLNRWAFDKKLDITKLSFHAVGHLLEDYCVLQSGSALGRGCGPLLVAGRNMELDEVSRGRVAIPGRYTTAALLFRMFIPAAAELVAMRFDKIMEAVAVGEVAAGVIIHESRFTYQQHGLICLADLGDWWEKESGLPIPLGCIAARRALGSGRIGRADEFIRNSLEWARANPEGCLDYIRSHSQELDEKVVRSHIELYVNDYSLSLGREGREAVAAFLEYGRERGVLPPSSRSIFCREYATSS